MDEPENKPEPTTGEDAPEPQEPTVLASKLDRLKSATLNVVRSRNRLPQPFFWSLFHSELQEIKKQKAHERLIRKIFHGIDS